MENPKVDWIFRVRYLIYAVILAILILMAGGCSAQWHIKKAISKDPSILQQPQTVRVDTVVVTEPRYLTDTVVLNDVDSVTITQDRVVTKIWRVHDTLRVNTICPADTVRITIYEDCPPVVNYTPHRSRWWVWVLIGIACVGGILFLLGIK